MFTWIDKVQWSPSLSSHCVLFTMQSSQTVTEYRAKRIASTCEIVREAVLKMTYTAQPAGTINQGCSQPRSGRASCRGGWFKRLRACAKS